MWAAQDPCCWDIVSILSSVSVLCWDPITRVMCSPCSFCTCMYYFLLPFIVYYWKFTKTIEDLQKNLRRKEQVYMFHLIVLVSMKLFFIHVYVSCICFILLNAMLWTLYEFNYIVQQYNSNKVNWPCMFYNL